MVLYHYWRSSASWRVRWALEIKNIPHEKIAVNLLAGEEKEEQYKQKNPSGYLPCLQVDGYSLGESLAIIEWLEETYPNPSLFFGSAFDRARVRQLAETVNAGTQPLQNLDVMRRHSSEKDAQAEWMKHWITRGLDVYESLLKTHGSSQYKFSLSNHPTMADLCLIPQCYSALRVEVDLANFPRCKAIYEYALTTEACQASRPEKFQPNQ